MRKQHGFSMKEVVYKSNGYLDKTSLSRIERNERGISLKVAYALSKIYNISMEQLVEIILNEKIEINHMPFETSSFEKTLLEAYRLLDNDRKKIVYDIIWGLSTTSQHGIKDSELKLKEALLNTREA